MPPESEKPSLTADAHAALETAYRLACGYRATASSRAPRAVADAAEIRSRFSITLSAGSRPAADVIKLLADAADPGLTGNASPNFYGWVMGGSHPAGVAADWLTSTWGQNAGIYRTSPAAAAAEDAVASWLLDMFDLPRDSGFGITTGATTAGFTCLAAARNAVLDRAGWSVEQRGVFGAPPVTVFLGEEAHSTIFAALRYLGFGEDNLVRIAVDDEGRMSANSLATRLAEYEGPKIVIAQAGHINSGAFDPFTDICSLAEEHRAWAHVDGAFGLWARCVDSLRPLCEGVDRADSWSVDGHKWLQAPYDTAFAIVKDAEAHRRAMRISASYLDASPEGERDPSSYVPELSRRARGFAVWALMQSLGRSGIEEIVSRHCRCAQRLRDRLAQELGVEILNEVVLNQLAIAFGVDESPEDQRRLTDLLIAAIQQRNRCYVGGADWKGRKIMRVSVISNDTDIEHIDLLADEIIDSWRQAQGEKSGA